MPSRRCCRRKGASVLPAGRSSATFTARTLSASPVTRTQTAGLPNEARSGMRAWLARIRWCRCGWSSTPNTARCQAISPSCATAASISALRIDFSVGPSKRRPHSSFLDKALSGVVDRAPFAAARRVDVEGAAGRLSCRERSRQGHLILHRQGVVGKQQLGAIDPVEQEQAPEEVGLAMPQMSGDDPGRVYQPPPTEMLAVEGALGGHQLSVELGERQPRGQNRVLDVVEPIISAGDLASRGCPAFGPGIWRVDADVDDFGQLDTPFTNDPEALMVPVRVRDQVDGDHDPERAGEFERLEIAAERDPFAMLAQSFFIDRLEADEHVLEPELSPQTEHLLVA